MSAFATAFTQFFTALGMLFHAFTNVATIADKITGVGVEASTEFEEAAAIKRIANRRKLNEEHGTNVQPVSITLTAPQ